MAFTQETFATVGAQSSDTPTVYAYKTTDTLAQVKATDYFILKSSQIEASDIIFVSASDGTNILQVNIDKSTTVTAEFLQSIDNRDVINLAVDLPEASLGVRTLPGNTEYYIGSSGLNIGTDRFVVGANVTISGGFAASVLTSTTTGDLFTGEDLQQFTINAVTLDAPNCTNIWNVMDNIQGTSVIAMVDSFTDNCGKVGTFEDVFAVNISNSNFANTGDGITLIGVNNVVSLRELAMISTTAGFKGVDFGVSTSPTIEFENILMIASGGSSFGISGAASSANVTANSIASVVSCEFLGGMTALETITIDDIRWAFDRNTGIPDTNQDALLTLTANVTATVIGTQGVGVLVAGTWVEERSSHFTVTTAGRSTFDGERPIATPIAMNLGLKAVTGNFDAFISVAKNGTIIANGVAVALSTSKPAGAAVIWQETLTKDDFIEVFVTNKDGTNNIVVESATIVIR